MIKVANCESAILLTDIVISSPTQTSPSLLDNDRVYIDILASKASGESISGDFQAKLKIRRVGPLEPYSGIDGQFIWVANESIDIPLSMHRIAIVLSTERANDSGDSSFGRIEKDMDTILDISLSDGICADLLEDLSGQKFGHVLGFKCVVIPAKEMMLFSAHEHGDRLVEDKRESQISAWLEQESEKQQRFEVLGNFFHQRFKRAQDIRDIDMTIGYQHRMVEITPDGHSDKPSWLSDLGNSLLSRYMRLGDLKDLDTSILATEKAIELTPEDHPDRASLFNNLGVSLLSRFQYFGDLNNLNKSILMMEKAIQLTPDGHLNKPSWLTNFGDSLISRFKRFGDINDLNKSILATDKAVQLTPDGHPDMPTMLNNYGSSLLRRFERFGDLNDLNESIFVRESAVEMTPDGHPDKAIWLTSFGSSLLKRFERLGNITDLNESILVTEKAVQLTPDDHPNMPSSLNNLGITRLNRFKRLGELNDLNNSILSKKKAVQMTPDGHPDKPSWLDNLGNSLLSRFELLGDLDDLNESILAKKKAVQLSPDGHPDKPSQVSNFGNSLLVRFERLGDVNDINESILMTEKAVQLTPDGHPDKPSLLNSFGVSLWSRFLRLGDLKDLEESVLVTDKAVQLTPDGHPDKPLRLNNFGISLLRRFEHLGNLNDLNKSILVMENAVQLTTDGHPSKPSWFYNLGSSLSGRLKLLGNHDDRIKSVTCYSAASLAITGRPSTKFRASSKWALLAEDVNDDVSRVRAYSTALGHLPRLAWFGSRIEDRHFNVKEAGNVIRRAAVAAIEHGNPTTAIEWLEQGRSIVWGQLLQLRAPIDDLVSSHPELGEKLRSLSSQLERINISSKPLHNKLSTSHISADYHEIAQERESLINNIRQLPGFDHFLLPKPISELIRVAQLGPVVVLNATKIRCDALAIVSGLDDAVLHIPLPDISLDDVEVLSHDLRQLIQDDRPAVDILFNRYRDTKRLGVTLVSQESDESYQERREKVFQAILLTLWDCVIEPVAQRLGLTTHTLNRIWWCPTGPFSFLPLHAAGNYSNDAAVGSKLMDYAISSYTPSLISLIQALDSVPRILSNTPRLLIVAQSSSTGQVQLPGTSREFKLIQDLAATNHNITIRGLKGADATVSRVKEEMGNATWAHFACHGVQDSKNPTQSALLLSGSSRLTLSEIIGMKMPSKDFAFLSACQTGTGAEVLSDESVHLAAGMLSAGYRGVIATMWSISDIYAPSVASGVYTHMFKKHEPDSTDAAEALHYAVKKLQQKPGVSCLDWVPFIHMGL